MEKYGKENYYSYGSQLKYVRYFFALFCLSTFLSGLFVCYKAYRGDEKPTQRYGVPVKR